jgi:hypothetical protein
MVPRYCTYGMQSWTTELVDFFTMRKRYSCSKQLFGAFEVDAALDNAVGGHFEVGDEIFMQCAIIWWFTESNAAPDKVIEQFKK